MKKVSDEPVVSAFAAVVVALLVLLAAFGVDLTEEQQGAILGFVFAVLGLAILVRNRVTPNK